MPRKKKSEIIKAEDVRAGEVRKLNVKIVKREYLYVVLIKAHTGLGKLSRMISRISSPKGYEYTHIAVCLKEPLEDFITFSRHKHYAPFDCGFMHETRDYYCYGDYNWTKVKVFKIPVSHEGMKAVKDYIAEVENAPETGRDSYIFNIFSMLTMGLLHGLPIYHAHNCMSFTAKLVELSGSVAMDRNYYRYDIKDMDELLQPYFYKEGYLKRKKTETPDYMERVPVFRQIGLMKKLNNELIFRMFHFKKV